MLLKDAERDFSAVGRFTNHVEDLTTTDIGFRVVVHFFLTICQNNLDVCHCKSSHPGSSQSLILSYTIPSAPVPFCSTAQYWENLLAGWPLVTFSHTNRTFAALGDSVSEGLCHELLGLFTVTPLASQHALRRVLGLFSLRARCCLLVNIGFHLLPFFLIRSIRDTSHEQHDNDTPGQDILHGNAPFTSPTRSLLACLALSSHV